MTVRILDATTPTTGTSIPESTFEATLSADVASMPRQYVVAAGAAAVSGTVYAARARVRKTATYSQLRFFTGTTAPSGLTDARFGVWDDTAAAKLAETANVSATITAATTIYTLTFVAPVALKRYQDVYIGGGFIGTTPPSLRGLSMASSPFAALAPVLAKQTTGWTTGVLPASLGSTSGLVMWAELLP